MQIGDLGLQIGGGEPAEQRNNHLSRTQDEKCLDSWHFSDNSANYDCRRAEEVFSSALRLCFPCGSQPFF